MEPSMEVIMNHKRDFPKVIINVGGVKHEVKTIKSTKKDNKMILA